MTRPRPNSLGEAVAAHYRKPPAERSATKWAPGADPLERVRRLAATVDASPGFADTLNAQDRAAVQTFIARREHLKAMNNDDTDTNGDDAA